MLQSLSYYSFYFKEFMLKSHYKFYNRDRQATQRPNRTSLQGGRSHRGWAMLSEIYCITVQDSLLFHRITLDPSLSMPAQDVSPKVRKSGHLFHQWSLKPTGFFHIPSHFVVRPGSCHTTLDISRASPHCPL
jgi:hypothetical protein